MTGGKDTGRQVTHNTEWLASHQQAFLERISTQGYAPCTVHQYERVTYLFCDEIKQRGLGPRDLDGPTIKTIHEAALRVITVKTRKYGKFCLERFVDHLVSAEVIAMPESPMEELTVLDRLGKEYEIYLHQQRGFSDATIYHCMRFLERFMTFRFGKTLGDLNAITPDDIVSFLSQLKAGSKPYRDKTPPTHLRNLFKFLFWSGKTKRNLANSIPRVAQAKPVNLPRYLKPEDVQRLIEAIRTDDVIGRRNYAMMLLLARLGLRAMEVIAIQLGDIDWRSGEILIRGKGKLHDRMPLPVDVGEAIVDYIRNGRRGTSRILFVSSITPPSTVQGCTDTELHFAKGLRENTIEAPAKICRLASASSQPCNRHAATRAVTRRNR
jgi:integrase/recombinase XerD